MQAKPNTMMAPTLSEPKRVPLQRDLDDDEDADRTERDGGDGERHHHREVEITNGKGRRLHPWHGDPQNGRGCSPRPTVRAIALTIDWRYERPSAF